MVAGLAPALAEAEREVQRPVRLLLRQEQRKAVLRRGAEAQRREDKAAVCKTFHFSSLLGRHLSTARIMEIPPFVKPAGRGA